VVETSESTVTWLLFDEAELLASMAPRLCAICKRRYDQHRPLDAEHLWLDSKEGLS
jgi:hypothetical protein